MKLHKKVIAILISLLMLLSALPLGIIAAQLGDVDGDGNITAADARLILRRSVGLEEFNEEQEDAADIDRDGSITAADARLALRCSVNLEELHSHSYTTENITVQASCITAGEKTFQCECGDVSDESEIIPALGHDYSSTVTKNATCSETGLITYTCSRCGDSYTEIIEKTAHTESEIPAVEASCTTSGFTFGLVCTLCGEILRERVELSALGHSYTDVAAKAASCTQNGWLAHRQCTRCNERIDFEESPALGHDYISHEALEATCTQTGYNAYQTCSRCDYSSYEEISALGHDYISHEALEATCTQTGYNAYQTCSRCDYSSYEEISALGHNVQLFIQEASCTQTGYSVMKCIRESCPYFEGEKYDETDALDHNYGEGTIINATCTKDGFIHYECARCQAISDEPIEGAQATGHSPDEQWVVTVAAACTQNGVRECSCTACEEKIKEEIPATGHNITSSFVEGNCTTKDKVTKKCSNDGCSFELPAVEYDYSHRYRLVTQQYPSCTENGSRNLKCLRCDNETTEIVEATGHSAIITESSPASCTEDGYAVYGGTCGVCNENINNQRFVLAAKGHNPGEEASCTTDQKCKDCNQVLVSAFGHDYKQTNNVLGEALDGFYCKRCGELHTEPLATFNALANAIKSHSSYAVNNRIARISKSTMTTEYTKFDFGIYTRMIKQMYEDEMKTITEYVPFIKNLSVRALQLPYQNYVSLLEAGDIDSIKVETIDGFNTADVLNTFDNSFTVGSNSYDVSSYKNIAVSGDVIKVTVDVRNETYAKQANLTNIPLDVSIKTSLNKIHEFDIRNEQKEYGDDWKITDSEKGEGYDINMTMSLERIDSDAEVIYYFDAETMAPILALYNTDIVMEQGVDMSFEIGLLSLKGVIEPLIYTEYNTAYLFSGYYDVD